MDTKEKRRRPRPVDSRPVQGKRPVRKERKLRDTDVVYTPPKPFKRGQFLLRLATVTAVVLVRKKEEGFEDVNATLRGSVARRVGPRRHHNVLKSLHLRPDRTNI